MSHKGTTIRYGQKQPVWNRQQGAKKFRRAAYRLYASKKNFSQRNITNDLAGVF
jgi:hypothetical protein